MITTQQLQLLKEGNKNAFEALYRGYNARIYNFVLSMVSNAGVAKDITQDIFLHIWEKRLNIDLEGNFDGYLDVYKRQLLFFHPGFIIYNKDRLLLLACQTDNFYLKIENNYELCVYCLLFIFLQRLLC